MLRIDNRSPDFLVEDWSAFLAGVFGCQLVAVDLRRAPRRNPFQRIDAEPISRRRFGRGVPRFFNDFRLK